jgi:hypothetical protein
VASAIGLAGAVSCSKAPPWWRWQVTPYAVELVAAVEWCFGEGRDSNEEWEINLCFLDREAVRGAHLLGWSTCPGRARRGPQILYDARMFPY